MNKRYQVFVSSTYADLKEERTKVIQTIMELDCIPAGMEIFPAIDEEQFEFIKRVIDDCDYYILIIGGRYGTLSEGGISYTEKEYDYAIKKSIRVLAFVHGNPDEIPIGKSEKETHLREKLERFKKKVETNRLVKYWRSINELPGLVALSLSKTIKTYPAIGWIRANTSADPSLYKELSELQKENKELKELNAEHNEKPNEELYDLADLSDSIKVAGTHRRSTGNHYINSDWETSITWGQIFSHLSPYLIEHPNDSKVNSLLSADLYRMTKDASTSGTTKLNDQDFQTIKIHLKAMGLIEVKYTKTVQGGMGLFWELTKVGEIMMMKLRSVKK
ncbi:MAG: DUF4062 domain-containing protein [Bacteroidetes bacterium]|nr:DUF4062 domain-containing protein [Bacteroidota bacterium]MBU1114458.1 DUF4062 domain-containing protein [Bacteroidota bacterium]MBU1798881.1 DUF4062 domain-containing protein [Bacteroidota bacterium]